MKLRDIAHLALTNPTILTILRASDDEEARELADLPEPERMAKADEVLTQLEEDNDAQLHMGLRVVEELAAAIYAAGKAAA